MFATSGRPRRVPLLAVALTALLCAPLTRGAPALASDVAGAAAAHGKPRWERQIVALTNAQRTRHGCPELSEKSSLRRAARAHSRLMARRAVLSHQLPGERDLVARTERTGYRHWSALGENIAFGQRSARAVVHDWMHSSSHRANILNCGYRHVGVGVHVVHGLAWITQDLGRQ